VREGHRRERAADALGGLTDRSAKGETVPAAWCTHPVLPFAGGSKDTVAVIKFLLWCILLVVCWPLALLALILYPIVWLLLLPFRLVGIAVEGVFELLRAIFTLPARVLRGPRL
jgi:hypothetical protein